MRRAPRAKPSAAASCRRRRRGSGLAVGEEPWIPRNFPEMLIGVSEIACVPAPEGFLRGLDDRRARGFRFSHDLVHFLLRANVVREVDVGRDRLAGGQPRVVRQALARPEREAQAVREIEERHRAVLELLADDALGFPAEAVAIEAHGAVEIGDAERDERDARLQTRLPKMTEAANKAAIQLE